MKNFYSAIQRLHDKGHTHITAQKLADEMWPDCRTHNANGQVFNLASGVAGRLLRKCRACHEVRDREWEIIPAWIDR